MRSIFFAEKRGLDAEGRRILFCVLLRYFCEFPRREFALQIPLVAASEKGKAQTEQIIYYVLGVVRKYRSEHPKGEHFGKVSLVK